MSNGSESGMYIGYPHVPRPIDSKNLSINLGLTIYYYEMPKVIAIGEDGKKFKVYLHLILEESLAIPMKESMRQ